MIDYFHIPNNLNHQVFFTAGDQNTWHTWTKPRNAKFIFMTAIGGGGGGGSTTTGQVRGGGGGGSSSISRLMVPANLIPDTLYISVGSGGIGGSTTGAAGQSGGISYISIIPSTGTPVAANVILASGAVGAAGGTAGSGTDGTGGAGGTVFTSTNGILVSLGLFQSVAGVQGANGSTGVGANITALASIPLTSGAAGAGRSVSSSAGGSIIGVGDIVPTISGGTAGANNGVAGFITIRPNEMVSQPEPFISTGGSGGGSNTSGNGGNGGDGQIGSGGGGAGSGSTGIASGGRGGDGVVIITCF